MAGSPISILSQHLSEPRNELIGYDRGLRGVWESVQTVARCNTPVLIQGETGTGKEVIARAIHDASPRRQRRFVAVNCAAIPAALLESELFGHEKGAFTGAVLARMGRFQVADSGTLFLDEIGEVPIELQPKLLRAIQEQEIERLGSSHTTQLDVRIISATNQNLEQRMAERQFRADLYYRLNVFPITLPPLRERTIDIPSLAVHFLHVFARRHGKLIQDIPHDVMAAMVRYEWPGNVRQLQNFIERCVILTNSISLQAPVAELKTHDQGAGCLRTLADSNRAHIVAALEQCNWVVGGPQGAAAKLGIKRTTLLYKMKNLGIATKAASAAPACCISVETPHTPSGMEAPAQTESHSGNDS